MKDVDKYRGCLVGGAAGDALGYAIEFWSENQIFSRYGRRGICGYELDAKGLARFSDDTQMTLFTANGLLRATTLNMMRGGAEPYAGYVGRSYIDWYHTQTKSYPLSEHRGRTRCSWLVDIPELFENRAPGNTCLSACSAGCDGTPELPINQSKGCGGIMRVAPVGLYLDAEDGIHCSSYADVQKLGAECAALTHGHELGWLPAGMLAHIVSRLAHDPACGVGEAVEDALQVLPEAYPNARRLDDLKDLVCVAMSLADSRKNDLDCIHELGEGWVAEETLAIAVFCALRHEDDFDGALVAAVNHNGDSDSTGAVCGNILGAKLGLSGIPLKFTERLELLDVIEGMADDLCADCQTNGRSSALDEVWEHKYVACDYVKWRRMTNESANAKD